jgi:hypothetical protein
MIRALKRSVLASFLAVGLLALGAGQSQTRGQSPGGHGGGYGGYRGGYSGWGGGYFLSIWGF